MSSTVDRKNDTRLTTIEPHTAGQKPSTTKPMLNQFWAIQDASHSDKALIHLQYGESVSSFLLEPFLTQVKTFDSRVGFNDLR